MEEENNQQGVGFGEQGPLLFTSSPTQLCCSILQQPYTAFHVLPCE